MSGWKNKLSYLYYVIGLIIISLITVQLFWMVNGVRLQKLSIERTLRNELNQIAVAVEAEAYCQMFYSKAYLKRGESIYVVKKPDSSGRADTIDTYHIGSNEIRVHDKDLHFSAPAAIDIGVKMRFFGYNPHLHATDSIEYSSPEALSNRDKSIGKMIDLALLDSLVADVLDKNGLNSNYCLEIKQVGAEKPAYRKCAGVTFTKSIAVRAPLLKGNFFKPYELALFVPDSWSSVVKSMMITLILSIVVIIALIYAYLFFAKTILNQRKLSEMKNMFINNVTHEFKTPITNINLAIENWRDSGQNTDFYIKIIEEENKHMERNVEQILQLAILDYKKHEISPEEIDAHAMIRDAAAAFEIQLRTINAQIQYNLQASHPFILAEKQHFQNLIRNLMDNSIKYRRGALKIGISTYNKDHQLVIEISDNGIGMPDETQKHLFTNFYRGNTGDVHNVKGFGLGLSYVKYIIEKYKGHIYVESKPGEGSKFTIYFPGASE